MPKGYIIAHVTVNDPDAYQAYVAENVAIFARLGGRYIVRGGTASAVEGSLNARHVIIEFDSYAEALAGYHDPAYQAHAEIRRASADSQIVVVEGTS